MSFEGYFADSNHESMNDLLAKWTSYRRFYQLSDPPAFPDYPDVKWAEVIHDDSLFGLSRFADPIKLAAAADDLGIDEPSVLWQSLLTYGLIGQNNPYLLNSSANVDDYLDYYGLRSRGDYTDVIYGGVSGYNVSHIAGLYQAALKMFDDAKWHRWEFVPVFSGTGVVVRNWYGSAEVETVVAGSYNESTMQSVKDSAISGAISDWKEVPASTINDLVANTTIGRHCTLEALAYEQEVPPPLGSTVYKATAKQWLISYAVGPRVLTFYSTGRFGFQFATQIASENPNASLYPDFTSTSVYDDLGDSVPAENTTAFKSPNLGGGLYLAETDYGAFSTASLPASSFEYNGQNTSTTKGWLISGNTFISSVDLSDTWPAV